MLSSSVLNHLGEKIGVFRFFKGKGRSGQLILGWVNSGFLDLDGSTEKWLDRGIWDGAVIENLGLDLLFFLYIWDGLKKYRLGSIWVGATVEPLG